MANPLKSLNGPAPTKNLFSRSVNKLPLKVLFAVALTLAAVTAGFTVYATPKYTNVGYGPDQPVPFSTSSTWASSGSTAFIATTA